MFGQHKQLRSIVKIAFHLEIANCIAAYSRVPRMIIKLNSLKFGN